jgi:CRISPR-associated endonuclease/helicase Cas3
LHDTGKITKEMQGYLIACYEAYLSNLPMPQKGSVDHKRVGATAIYKYFKGNSELLRTLLVFLTSGHHSGLYSKSDITSEVFRDPKIIQLYENNEKELMDYVNQTITNVDLATNEIQKNIFELQIRMLFSCLVDADYLHTESHFSPLRSLKRQKFSIHDGMLETLIQKQNQLATNAPSTKINKMRSEIFEQCILAGEKNEKLFVLAAPTGSSKTLSSMALALKHAITFNKDNIIIVLPYTSIIDQTADIYRNIFGEDIVIEHHCNFDPEIKLSGNIDDNKKYMMAFENWDKPIIVTTTVQFFESLLSSKTSKCRKNHNIANSVVIFDECQMLPTLYLKAIIKLIEELTEHFGVTAILSTATQPPFDYQSSQFNGLTIKPFNVLESSSNYFEEFKRVQYIYETDNSIGKTANRICKHSQILTIVDTKKYANMLYEIVKRKLQNKKYSNEDRENLYHLSGNMYPQDRLKIIYEIKQKLKEGKKCRLISTQLIECGVDIDFPVVIRSLAGLDHIIQSGGRANREGNLVSGLVYVINMIWAQIPNVMQEYLIGQQTTLNMLTSGELDFNNLKSYDKYFQSFWDRVVTNQHNIGYLRNNLQFSEIQEKFHIIHGTINIVVRTTESSPIIEDLIYKLNNDIIISRYDLRKLQQFTVNHFVSKEKIDSFLTLNPVSYIEELGIYVWNGYYDPKVGITIRKGR